MGALGGLLAARLLGPAGRGELAVFVLFATVLSMAAAAGVQFWIAREVARTRGVLSSRWVAQVHVAVIAVAGAVVALVGVAAVVLEDWSSPATALAGVAFGTTAAIGLTVLALPNGMRKMGVVALATVVAAAVYASVTAILLVVDIASPALILLGGAFGNLCAIALALGWARHAPAGSGPANHGMTAYRRAVRFGLPAGVGELVLLTMLRVDVLIVALFLPLRAVGLYAVATALTELLWVVPDGVAQVVLPTTARDPDRSRTVLLLLLTIGLTAGGGALLIVVAPELLEIGFGERFVAADAAVPWLVAAAIAGGIWKIVGAEVVARGRTLPRLTSAVVGLVVMVAADVVAVPTLGIEGAALGSALGYGAAAGVVFVAWTQLRRPAVELFATGSRTATIAPASLEVPG
jgi:O-antigen/teichoic acid export membrane protein